MRTLGIWVAAWGVCAMAAGGCGGDDGASGGSGGAGASTSSAGGGGSGGGGTGACDPPCPAGQFCSVTNACIPDGTCAGDLDCTEPGTICDEATGACVPGGMCGAQEISVQPVPPNLLVVLDRSCSMQNNVGGVPKWTIAVQAIGTMLTDFDGQIRFGLTMFPDTVAPSCQQDAIPVPVAPGNEMAIYDLLTAALVPADPNYPDGPCVTNIDTAMSQAATEPALDDATRDSYVLLLTDGAQSSTCGGNAADPITEATIADLYQNRGVATFVIGFDAAADAAALNLFANAGGVPDTMGQFAFYNATDQGTLDAALQTIATKTLGCTFTLDEVPPSQEEIFVFLDNQKVQQDPTHTSGWDYDPATNQVTFYGERCDALKAGTVMDVDIVFGCDEPTPE